MWLYLRRCSPERVARRQTESLEFEPLNQSNEAIEQPMNRVAAIGLQADRMALDFEQLLQTEMACSS